MKYRNLLIGSCAIVLIIGVLMVYSSSFWISQSFYSNSYVMLRNHLIYLFVSIVAAFLISKVSLEKLHDPKLLIIILCASIIILGVLLLLPPHVGVRRWLRFLHFSIQPTEFIKIGVILYLSVALSNPSVVNNPISLLRSIIILGVICTLILLQPHFGMFIVIASVSLALFIISGVKVKYILLIGALLALVTVGAITSNPYMYNRLKGYFSPEKSYHVKECLKSIGSGGLFGKGFGCSQAKAYHLPIPHSDSIYAIVAEEGGFLLAISVLLLFFLIFYSGIKISLSASSNFASLFGIGLTLLIIIPFIINISVVTGIIPTTGLSLPFISYGGSALLSNMLCIGLLVNIHRTRWRITRIENYVF